MKPSEIYNFIVSNSSTAKNLLENLMNIPPKCEHKYLYIRVIYKSIAQNSKYFPEYEKILEILYDETTVYSSESIVGWNQLLRTLCSMVRTNLTKSNVFLYRILFSVILQGIL